MSFKDLFGPHSLLFASHSYSSSRIPSSSRPRSLGFAPSEAGGMTRELLFLRCSPDFSPLEGLFASHSPEPEWLEAERTWLEEEEMRYCKLFPQRSPCIA
jgi:hypothetical protein